MQSSTACEAIKNGVCLELIYNGFRRVVEVHAVGLSSERNWLMRVWRISGGSKSGEPGPWRLMRLDQVTAVRLSDQKSMAPRPGYKRGDSDMLGGIKCQI